MARDKPHDEARACACIAEIERLFGRLEAADADALNAPDARLVSPGFVARDRCAQPTHGLGGRQHVFTFQKARNDGLTDRQSAENQRLER